MACALASARGLLVAAAAMISLAGGCASPWAEGFQARRGGEILPQTGPADADQLAPSGPAQAAVAQGEPVRPLVAPVGFNRAAPVMADAQRAAFDAALGPVNAITETDRPTFDWLDGLSRVSFAEEGADFHPRVSKDGSGLVFASTQHRPTADIYLQRVGSRSITQLTSDPGNDVMPALSPDNARIAFASDRTGSWSIYVMSAAGGQAVQLTADGGQDLHPSWSPDGARIVFCRLGAVSGRWELWVVPVERPSAAEFIGYGLFPEWSPVAGAAGADKILFQRGRERGERSFSLWTLDYAPGSASNPTEVIAGAGFAAIDASWSPDGQHIAYCRLAGDASGGLADAYGPLAGATAGAPGVATDLWISTADGQSRVNLTAGKFVNLMPTWSPDGRLFFVTNRGGGENIWAVSTGKAIAAMGAPAAAPNAPATASAHSGHAQEHQHANPVAGVAEQPNH